MSVAPKSVLIAPGLPWERPLSGHVIICHLCLATISWSPSLLDSTKWDRVQTHYLRRVHGKSQRQVETDLGKMFLVEVEKDIEVANCITQKATSKIMSRTAVYQSFEYVAKASARIEGDVSIHVLAHKPAAEIKMLEAKGFGAFGRRGISCTLYTNK